MTALAAVAAALAADEGGRAPFEGRFEFRSFTKEDGLEDLSVECVIQDRVGFIWVGTDDGLFRYDGSRFRKFGHRDGLPRLRIFQLHETGDGRLYVATAGGVEVFSAEGQHLGTIPVSRAPQNIAFAGPNKKTLYIVGRGAAYKVQLLAQGFTGRAK